MLAEQIFIVDGMRTKIKPSKFISPAFLRKFCLQNLPYIFILSNSGYIDDYVDNIFTASQTMLCIIIY